MKLIEILYLLSFCGHLTISVKPTDIIPTLNTFIDRINSTFWNELNNNEFNPDVIFNTPEMIRNAGYPAEAYIIMTKDGYLLTLHRIPGDNGSPPVLLQHGVVGTSADWIVLGKGKALAYLLADQGYDVWLGNFRGNIYSRAHISLSPTNTKFWDFSFNELGIYDLPAMITFIKNMTSQSLHTYIGYSMGTTSFYVMASECPEIARTVQLMISLAPVVFLNHMRSPIKFFVPFSGKLKQIAQLLFHGEVLPSKFMRFLMKYICDQNLVKRLLCTNMLFMITGYDYKQFNFTMLPAILGHYPASTSVKSLVHYAQEIQSGKFRKYDYGRVKNLMIYNSVEPPDYDLANITVRTALIYSKNDWLVSIEDAKMLYHKLLNVVDIYEVPWPKFNHVDFIWAKDAPKLVYEKIHEIMRRENLNITSAGMR